MKRITERLFATERAVSGSEAVRRVLDRHGRDPSRIIGIMQDMQHAFGYLPEHELRFVASELAIPLSRIYHVATFYRAFRLVPRGRHEIKLCRGTACHVRGVEIIKDTLERELGIGVGDTTDDQRFSLETVRCIGCCGLAPVMMVGDEVEGRLKPSTVSKVLEKYE